MRSLVSLVCIGLIAGSLQAQTQALTGPLLGFTPDSDGTAIRQIIGIPGASMLGNQLQIAVNIRGVLISPKQDYAIAIRGDGQFVVIDLRTSAPEIKDIAGIRSVVGLMAISPTGSVAAIYADETRTVQIIGHLPDAPVVIQELDASRVPGRGGSVAVSDDGAVALVRFDGPDSSSLWALDSSGTSWRVAVDQPSAVAFFPNSSNAVVGDDATQSAFLILDVRRLAARIPLLSRGEHVRAFASASTSEDGRRVFLADAKSGNIAIVDTETLTPVFVHCDCRATGLHRLKGASVFRLTETSRDPMMVLDASEAEPRILVIPPSASRLSEAQ
jgi:hypothetical protein